MNHRSCLLVLCFSGGLLGCAELPAAKSFSVSGSFAGAEVSAHVKFEPKAPVAPPIDPKVIKVPAVEAMRGQMEDGKWKMEKVRTVDFRTERIVDPPEKALRGEPGSLPLIVTRFPGEVAR